MLKMVKEQNRNKSWPLQCFAAVMMTMQSIHNSLGKKAWTWIFPVLVLFEFYSPIINIVLHKNNLILPWEKLLLYLKTKSLKFNPKSIVFANDLWILFLLAALLLCRSKWSPTRVHLGAMASFLHPVICFHSFSRNHLLLLGLLLRSANCYNVVIAKQLRGSSLTIFFLFCFCICFTGNLKFTERVYEEGENQPQRVSGLKVELNAPAFLHISLYCLACWTKRFCTFCNWRCSFSMQVK